MILDDIVADKKIELAESRRRTPVEELRRMIKGQPRPQDFASVLRGESIRLIAEVKKASPSAGLIRADFDPVDIARIYARNGASAISVLTEVKYFQGNLSFLKDIGRALGKKRPPLLRKDFVFDSYQVYEARAYSADAILLIVAILSPEKLKSLLDLSRELGMECLVETHDEREVETALKSGARVIGINNRDLKTFKMDITTTERLRMLIPGDKIIVSESGIKTREDIVKLRGWGIDAVLIGEALTASPDIAGKMKELFPLPHGVIPAKAGIQVGRASPPPDSSLRSE
ncbi:MAG: indole-3-glycerol phosphate synthase TrpC [Chloroflexi bacterium]|nr:indole-3-glycerol phosphate synthase TrpC [Chloroflexota bacterium]